MNFLQGKKTYLAALAAVIGVLLAYLSGEMTQSAAIQAGIAAVLAVFIRTGSKSDAEAVLNGEKPK